MNEALKEGGRSGSEGARRNRLRGALVTAEVAIAVVLLIGAGLMVRSLSALWKVDPGFRTENLLTFGVAFPPGMRTATPEASFANLRDLSRQLNSLPGVVGSMICHPQRGVLSRADGDPGINPPWA